MASRDRPTVFLLAVLLASWLAMLLAGGPGSAGDLALLKAAAIPGLVVAAEWLSRLGGGTILVPLALAVALALAICGERRKAVLLIALVLIGRLLVEWQKMAFDRARPDPAGHLVAVHSMAFPSGHAAGSMTTALGIALIAIADPRLRRAAILLALLFSLLVGLSRLVLGVHWPSDVVGGWAFGAAWTLALVRLAGGDVRRTAERPAASSIESRKERQDEPGQ